MRNWQLESGLVGPLSAEEIEDYYRYLMASGFYSEEYCQSWNPHPYELMRNMLFSAVGFQAMEEVVDVGCGAGFLVHAMVDKGLSATGYDFSEEMVHRARAGGPGEFRFAKKTTDIDASRARLIIMMEVLEHLPLSMVLDYFAHWRKFDANLFLTIPSFGLNPNLGIVNFVATNDEWRRSMEAGSFFTHVSVDHDPKMGGGHILLAGVDWWENFLQVQGYVRDVRVESHFRQFSNIFKAYQWCPYYLRKLELDRFNTVFSQGPVIHMRTTVTVPGRKVLQVTGIGPDITISAGHSLGWMLYEIRQDEFRFSLIPISSGIVPIASGAFEVSREFCCDSPHLLLKMMNTGDSASVTAGAGFEQLAASIGDLAGDPH